jgi:opacity protein-like surface antigen
MYGKIGFKVGVAKINLKTSTSVNNSSGLRYENITMNNYNSADIDNIITADGEGKFEQKISYYEMPLEFNYALKKDESPFGIEAFTGFSILILDKNELSFSSESFKNQKIGELKNISETNLSFNLGLGFNYKLTEKFQLDFNPIFKYYLTTYNEDGSAKPYSLSIQSGVTYKF